MKHFTYDEFIRSETADKYKIENTPDDEIKRHIQEFVEICLDPLREAWGSAIIVTSGYRSPELNKKTGGSSTSAHLCGYAADLIPKNGKKKDFYNCCQKFLLEYEGGFDQLIKEHPDKNGVPSWVHIGFRNGHGLQRRQIFIIK